MTLLPDVRRQVHEAAERQATSRRQRVLTRVTAAGVTRGRSVFLRSYLAPVLSVLVVIAVVAVFIGAHGRGRSGGSRSLATVRVVFVAQPPPQLPVVTRSALLQAAEIMRERLGSVFRDAQITVSGRTLVIVVRHAPAGARARVIALSAPARLEFYDWEANALAPNGKTVASQLRRQDPTAITISQGSGSGAPGTPGAGSLPLYDAVKLAAKQPAQVSSDNGRLGSQYYLFGAPGSAACTTVAKAQRTTPSPGVHCLLAGPDDSQQELLLSLKSLRLSMSQGQELVIRPGTVVIQAADPHADHQTTFNDPNAQFYVLEDHVALSGNEITNPRQTTDQSGSPNVIFGFSSLGASAFHKLTSTIAHRGALVSGLGNAFNQHFAVTLDDKLITVPQIDFKTYPDGITGDNGADLTAAFTTRSAQDFATQLRLGVLPLTLNLA